MKELFKIFVEGDADKRFISQLLEFLFKTSIDQGNIIKTSGWNCLVSPKTEEVYVNQMNRTSADGRGQNTLEVVYNYKKMKYEVLCLTDSKLAQKEISIL